MLPRANATTRLLPQLKGTSYVEVPRSSGRALAALTRVAERRPGLAGQSLTSRTQHSAGQAEKALSVFRYCANLILIIEFIIDTVQRGEVTKLGLHI